MPETYGDVPFIDPATGRFPDKFAPESVALDVKRAEDAAAAAATAKGEVEQIAGGIGDTVSEAVSEQITENVDPKLTVIETARGEAVEAAGEAVAAKGDAVAAAQRAEAVPAQVDTAMAEQVGSGGEFDTKLSATFVAVFPDTTITYDGAGNVETVTDNGVTTTYAYNGDGSVATDTRLGRTREYTYDGAGNLVSIEEVA